MKEKGGSGEALEELRRVYLLTRELFTDVLLMI
jgi:hypothetical protein